MLNPSKIIKNHQKITKNRQNHQNHQQYPFLLVTAVCLWWHLLNVSYLFLLIQVYPTLHCPWSFDVCIMNKYLHPRLLVDWKQYKVDLFKFVFLGRGSPCEKFAYSSSSPLNIQKKYWHVFANVHCKQPEHIHRSVCFLWPIMFP